MTLAELNKQVQEYETELAPGSETPLLGDYNERMRQITGQVGVCAKNPDVKVPTPEARWWLKAYALYSARPDCDNLQGDIYDSVRLPR